MGWVGGCCGEGCCAWRLLSFARLSVEHGGLLAGAAHPRRQKHREMPPPGASAPAFAATAEPASCPLPCKHPRQDASSTRDGGCAKDEPLTASILDFRARLGNRCKVLPVYALLRASILKFKPRFENRCKVFPGNALQRAVILDFRGSIWESLHGFAWKRPPACSDS